MGRQNWSICIIFGVKIFQAWYTSYSKLQRLENFSGSEDKVFGMVNSFCICKNKRIEHDV